MKITKVSPFTGLENTMEIDVPIDQLIAWRAGGLIQNVMPQLSADEREFMMTGLTPKCWDDAGLNDEPNWLLGEDADPTATRQLKEHMLRVFAQANVIAPADESN